MSVAPGNSGPSRAKKRRPATVSGSRSPPTAEKKKSLFCTEVTPGTWACKFEGCDFSSKHFYSMQRHFQRLHINQFSCNWEGCNFVARNRQAIRIHQGTHELESFNTTSDRRTPRSKRKSKKRRPAAPATGSILIEIDTSRQAQSNSPEIDTHTPDTLSITSSVRSSSRASSEFHSPSVDFTEIIKDAIAAQETARDGAEEFAISSIFDPSVAVVPSSADPSGTTMVQASSSNVIAVSELPKSDLQYLLDLNPVTSEIFLESREIAVSASVEKQLLEQSCVVLRNFSAAIGLDLEQFASKKLANTAATMKVEALCQKKPQSLTDLSSREEDSWKLENSPAFMTVAEYELYQSRERREEIRKKYEEQFGEPGDVPVSAPSTVPESTIRFVRGVPMRDKVLWPSQLAELAKVPDFLNCNSLKNMLNYYDHCVSSVTFTLQVTGCRTAGNQENVSFCVLDLNTGPGTCEWFCIDYKYWGVVHDLCEKKKLSFLRDSWWPNLVDLATANIPVCRFLQHAGDLVWINSGMVYWHQALESCNNVSWTMAPFTAEQYWCSMLRYEWNKGLKWRSMVPMLNMTWNMAAKATFASPKDDYLIKLVRSVLYQTINEFYDIFKHISYRQTTMLHIEHERPYCCEECQAEIFNIAFFDKPPPNINKKVRCYTCAHKIDPAMNKFSAHYKYSAKQLLQIYNGCQLKVENL